MKTLKLLLPLFISVLVGGCSDDDNKNNQKSILSFKVGELMAYINEYTKYVELTLPSYYQVNEIKPQIIVSRGAQITPNSGEMQDFSNPVIYTVRAENGSKQKYTVNIIREKSSLAYISNFKINGVSGEIKDEHNVYNHKGTNSIIVRLKGVNDVTNLTPIIEVPIGAKVYPEPNVAQDFSNPIVYKVTSEDGKSYEFYTVGVQYDDFPSGHLYATSLRKSNNTTGDFTLYSFKFDRFRRISEYEYTNKPFYMGDSLIEGNLIKIKYGDKGRISKLILEERKKDVESVVRELNVTYSGNEIIYVRGSLTNGETVQDIITLDVNNLVLEFKTKNKTIYYVYDTNNNLSTIEDNKGFYELISYDDYNSGLAYVNMPKWLFLYTTGSLIGTGKNNPIKIESYDDNKNIIETIDFTYKYDSRTRYPRTWKYTSKGNSYESIMWLKYIFPYSLSVRYWS